MNMHAYKGVWQGRVIMQQSVWAEMHTVQYAQQIASAIAAGNTPAYDSWGLGPLIRGTGPALAADAWFGFMNQPGPNIFGHVGIDTTMAVGDPDQELAIVFMTTNSPNPSARATDLRNGVTDRIYQALIR
jgi:CubicO group peptidase (beta-lactamase class C family)